MIAVDIALDQERQEIDAARGDAGVGRKGDDRAVGGLGDAADLAHARREQRPDDEFGARRRSPPGRPGPRLPDVEWSSNTMSGHVVRARIPPPRAARRCAARRRPRWDCCPASAAGPGRCAPARRPACRRRRAAARRRAARPARASSGAAIVGSRPASLLVISQAARARARRRPESEPCRPGDPPPEFGHRRKTADKRTSQHQSRSARRIRHDHRHASAAHGRGAIAAIWRVDGLRGSMRGISEPPMVNALAHGGESRESRRSEPPGRKGRADAPSPRSACARKPSRWRPGCTSWRRRSAILRDITLRALRHARRRRRRDRRGHPRLAQSPGPLRHRDAARRLSRAQCGDGAPASPRRGSTEGAALALISDAGTPLVSDPGYKLVAEALAAGVAGHQRVRGPRPCWPRWSSPVCRPTGSFSRVSCRPKAPRGAARINAACARCRATLVFFESPRRLAETLADLAAELGDRPAAVARELTKML